MENCSIFVLYLKYERYTNKTEGYNNLIGEESIMHTFGSGINSAVLRFLHLCVIVKQLAGETLNKLQ